MGDSLLIGGRHQIQLALDHGHLRLVGGAATFRVGTMAVAVSTVGAGRLAGGIGGDRLGERGVQAGDVVFQERRDRLPDQLRRHDDELLAVLLVGSPPCITALLLVGLARPSVRYMIQYPPGEFKALARWLRRQGGLLRGCGPGGYVAFSGRRPSRANVIAVHASRAAAGVVANGVNGARAPSAGHLGLGSSRGQRWLWLRREWRAGERGWDSAGRLGADGIWQIGCRMR